MSGSDNTHQTSKFDSRGTYLPANDGHMDAINNAVRSLGVDVEVVSTVVNIASDEEKNQMSSFESSTGNATMLKIYRNLDPRRYSMYFNRFMAFKMAMMYESNHAFNFDWIVHVRPDMMWGAPIQDVSHWTPDKIWFPSHWASDVPDTFALIPRHRADLYYSLEDLYANRNVGCLGGPNFDPKSTSNERLIAAGFSEHEISLIKEELCLEKFPDLTDREFDKALNITWNNAGLSEIMLKRKLAVHGVSVERQTLGYMVAFTALVRYPLHINCFYTLPRTMIAWAEPYVNNTVAMGAGCLFVSAFVQRTQDIQQQLNFTSPCDILPSNGSLPAVQDCALTDALTDFNFLPIRVHPNVYQKSCITAADGSLHLTECQEMCGDAHQRVRYSNEQLFSFFPRTTLPQQIMQVPVDDPESSVCITVVTATSAGSAGAVHESNSMFRRAVKLRRCSRNNIDSQLFSVRHIGVNSTDFDTASRHVMFVWAGGRNMHKEGPHHGLHHDYDHDHVHDSQHQHLCLSFGPLVDNNNNNNNDLMSAKHHVFVFGLGRCIFANTTHITDHVFSAKGKTNTLFTLETSYV